MATKVQVVFDTADPDKVAHFWAEALGYKLQDPPQGFDSWEAFLRHAGVPEEKWHSASAVVDPDGAGPRLYFQQVPEGKIVKNRVHLDLNVGGGRAVPEEIRRATIAAEVSRLVDIGATKVREVAEEGEYCVVMQDPEGNEFCLQ
jgi:catechol 2,3-dioxygenase-like lactoylglutathione lyase family enzyme